MDPNHGGGEIVAKGPTAKGSGSSGIAGGI